MVVVQIVVWARVKRPLVQILVAVANIQMRPLKTEVGKFPREMQLDVGYLILRDRRNPFQSGQSLDGPAYQKGIRLIFLYQDVDIEW